MRVIRDAKEAELLFMRRVTIYIFGGKSAGFWVGEKLSEARRIDLKTPLRRQAWQKKARQGKCLG